MLKKENVIINCDQCLCIKNGQDGSFCVSVPVHDEVTGLSGKASIQCSVSPDSHQVTLENWQDHNKQQIHADRDLRQRVLSAMRMVEKRKVCGNSNICPSEVVQIVEAHT